MLQRIQTVDYSLNGCTPGLLERPSLYQGMAGIDWGNLIGRGIDATAAVLTKSNADYLYPNDPRYQQQQVDPQVMAALMRQQQAASGDGVNANATLDRRGVTASTQISSSTLLTGGLILLVIVLLMSKKK